MYYKIKITSFYVWWARKIVEGRDQPVPQEAPKFNVPVI
jgi:hypothetical protein